MKSQAQLRLMKSRESNGDDRESDTVVQRGASFLDTASRLKSHINIKISPVSLLSHSHNRKLSLQNVVKCRFQRNRSILSSISVRTDPELSAVPQRNLAPQSEPQSSGNIPSALTHLQTQPSDRISAPIPPTDPPQPLHLLPILFLAN